MVPMVFCSLSLPLDTRELWRTRRVSDSLCGSAICSASFHTDLAKLNCRIAGVPAICANMNFKSDFLRFRVASFDGFQVSVCLVSLLKLASSALSASVSPAVGSVPLAFSTGPAR